MDSSKGVFKNAETIEIAKNLHLSDCREIQNSLCLDKYDIIMVSFHCPNFE